MSTIYIYIYIYCEVHRSANLSNFKLKSYLGYFIEELIAHLIGFFQRAAIKSLRTEGVTHETIAYI